MRSFSVCFAAVLFGLTCFATPDTVAPVAKRPLKPADLYRLPSVSDPQISPDGKWVAYTLSTIDSVKDKHISSIWMISIDGSLDLKLTNSPEGESKPRWSPDSKYLSFLSFFSQPLPLPKKLAPCLLLLRSIVLSQDRA